MNIYELVAFVRDGTDAPIDVRWKWEKISSGNECKTLIVQHNDIIKYWQGHKYKDPEKLRETVYAAFNIHAKTELFG